MAKFVKVHQPHDPPALFRIVIGRIEESRPDGSPGLIRIYEEGDELTKDDAAAGEFIPVLLPEEVMQSL